MRTFGKWLGLEQDGNYITDGEGVAFVLGGLNFTTRDYVRFGQMILQNGEYGSNKWCRRIGSLCERQRRPQPRLVMLAMDINGGYRWMRKRANSLAAEFTANIDMFRKIAQGL